MPEYTPEDEADSFDLKANETLRGKVEMILEAAAPHMMVQVLDEGRIARALYIEDHASDTITERDDNLKPREEYERRAGVRWDSGIAGSSHYQQYPRRARAVIAALEASNGDG